MNKFKRILPRLLMLALAAALMTQPAFAIDDMWTVANNLIVDIYAQIVGISTVLAGLMSAVAVIGAKISNNQHKVDQAWDWLKRIWIAWVIINGIGAFIAYIAPHFPAWQPSHRTLPEAVEAAADAVLRHGIPVTAQGVGIGFQFLIL